MSLTALPTIAFGSGGSDVAASGAGPATALTGSAGAVTGASATATIGDAVDLSGVAVDGSAVLWIQTASGRQFSRISAISGTSGAWSLTLQDSAWTTSAGKTWGIGGKRATFANADSRKLFSADVKPGWTVTTDADQSISTALACSVAGDAATGVITVKGTTAAPRPKIVQTANAALIAMNQQYWRWESLQLTCSSGTRTNCVGIDIEGGIGPLTVYNCILGDATNKLQVGVQRGAGNARFNLIASTIQNCVSHAINEVSGTSDGSLEVHASRIVNNGGIGLQCHFAGNGVTVLNTIVAGNGNEGIYVGNTDTQRVAIVNCTIHGNGAGGTNSGIKTTLAATAAQMVVYNCAITANAQYGINLPAGTDAWKALLDYNDYGTGALANTSGPASGFTTGSHSLAIDPTYASTSTGDYTPGNAAMQAGLTP